MELKWYAVYTKPSHEIKVAALLKKMKIESYCPLHIPTGMPHKGNKSSNSLLFPSYVFVRAYKHQHDELKQIKGVINLIYWLSNPVEICDKEIQTIKDFLHKYRNVRLERISVNLSRNMQLLNDPLTSQEGKVVVMKDNMRQAFLLSLGYLIIGETQNPVMEVTNKKNLVSITNSEHKYAI